MRVRIFLTGDESGAVTVDWTVLTAAVAGLSLAAVAMMRTGTGDLGGEIASSLAAVQIAGQGGAAYAFLFYTPLQQQNAATNFAARADATLGNNALQFTGLFNDHMASGNLSAAGMMIDNIYLVTQELGRRGLSLPDGAMTYAAMLTSYTAATAG